MRAPSPSPTSCSLRYAAAHSARPGSTGRSKVKTRLETPPVEVMITTISTCGWSSSTSTWRIVVVRIGGAETIASRFVTCESASVVAPHRLVDLAAHERRAGARRAARRAAAGAARRRSSGSPRRSARGPRRCADARAAPAPRARRARCGRSTGPALTSGSAASAFEPTGCPVSAKPSTTLRSSSSWRGVSTPSILGDRAGGAAAGRPRPRVADDLVAVLLGVAADHESPSRSSRTVELIVISCSGRPMPRNCTSRRAQRSRARRRPRSARGRPGPSSTARAGCGRAGRPTARTRRRVDRVEVARRARVAVGQVLVRRDLELDVRPVDPSHDVRPGRPRTRSAPSWLVETDPKT